MADRTAQLVKSLPPGLLNQVAALSPPPGVKSNLVDPYSRGPTFSVAATVLIFVTLVFFGVRVYTKACVIRKFSWDDCAWDSNATVTMGANTMCK